MIEAALERFGVLSKTFEHRCPALNEELRRRKVVETALGVLPTRELDNAMLLAQSTVLKDSVVASLPLALRVKLASVHLAPWTVAGLSAAAVECAPGVLKERAAAEVAARAAGAGGGGGGGGSGTVTTPAPLPPPPQPPKGTKNFPSSLK